MGIVQRQSIKYLVVSLLATLIGALSVLFIYPLNDELYGFAQWLYSTAFLLLPIASLGVHSAVVKYYPNFRNSSNSNHGFFPLIILALVLLFFVFLMFFFIFKASFYKFFVFAGLDVVAIETYETYLLILCFELCLFYVFVNFSTAGKRIVVPNILQNVLYKIFLPSLFLVSIYFAWGIDWFVKGIVIYFAVLNVFLFVYVRSLNMIPWGKIDIKGAGVELKEMASYISFSSMSSIGTHLTFRIDAVMIPLMLSMTANGIYMKIMFIVQIISIPIKSIVEISRPLISEHWKDQDLKAMNKLHQQSSNNLLFVGGLVFLLIWFNIGDVVALSGRPESFEGAKNIILVMGSAVLFQAYAGISSNVLTLSPLYKYNLIFLILLGVFNLILNYFLIKSMGIFGAALATSISLSLILMTRLLFNYWKFGMNPTSKNNLINLLLIAAIFGLSFVIKLNFGPLVNLIIYTLIVSALYILFGLYLKISSEINNLVKTNILKYTGWNIKI